MLRLVVAAIVYSLATPSHVGAFDRGRPPIRALPTAEAQAWIAGVRSQITRDGATVLQVLEFVQQLRPQKFRFGDFDIGYNGASGEPDGVSIGYWIGLKRLPGDEYSFFFFVKREGGRLKITAKTLQALKVGLPSTFEEQILDGRDSFLQQIDEEYERLCTDPDRHEKTC